MSQDSQPPSPTAAQPPSPVAAALMPGFRHQRIRTAGAEIMTAIGGAGPPLIVSDIGGMAEKVLRNVDGLHFKRAAPVDLARVMVQATDPELRAALGASIRDMMGRAEFLAALDAATGMARQRS